MNLRKVGPFLGLLIGGLLAGSAVAQENRQNPAMTDGQNPMAALAAPSGPGRTGPEVFSAHGFEAGHIAWVAAGALGTVLLIPGWLCLYRGASGRPALWKAGGQIMVLVVLLSLGWGLALYSLAFGLNWGAETVPAHALTGPNGYYTGSPLIGGTGNMVWNGLEPQVAADKREYPMRRPRDYIPHALFMGLQMFVALAAPIPLIVTLSDRIRTGPLIAATLGWVALVYVPLTHWIRGFGWLRQSGALDFAGASVVQMAAGFSVLGLLPLLRRSAPAPSSEEVPPQTGLALLGGALLWAGSLFLNGASAHSARPAAVAAILCAHLAACAGAVGWAGAAWLRAGRARFEDLALGAVAGLAAISACSGLVALQSALVIGLVSGVLCRLAWTACAPRHERDVLSVFAIQGVGGCLGLVLTGIFASSNFAGVNEAGQSIEGLLSTDATLLVAQLKAALMVAVVAPVGSLLVFGTVRALCRHGWSETALPEKGLAPEERLADAPAL